MRYVLEKVGITADYYIVDSFTKEYISLVTGECFAKPLVDLLNKYEELLSESNIIFDDEEVESFLSYVSRPSTDEELDSLVRADKVYNTIPRSF